MSNLHYGNHKGVYKPYLKLLTTNTYKTVKSQAYDYLNAILYLAPAMLAKSRGVLSKLAQHDPSLVAGNRLNVCPSYSTGCVASCLFISGSRRIWKRLTDAPIRKTLHLINSYDAFFDMLSADISKLARLSAKHKLKPCIRLNGTSDIAFEHLPYAGEKSIFALYPGVQFYDYTKRYDRMKVYMQGKLPANYYLTFSRSEVNEKECIKVLKKGYNVSAVFRRALPATWKGYKVYSGDNSDLRFLDPLGSVIGLTAKACAKHDRQGFVIR